MTTLHDRLADLAEEAPTPGAAPGAPTGLWERGLRYRRVRRAGTLAVLGAAVLVLALLGGLTWQRAAPPVQPASGSVGLPDQVWDPSPWLPTTDRPGQLVAMGEAMQGGWTGMHSGLAVVSATTGQYSFLDGLPDVAPRTTGEAVLSPDGRHIAYWLTGSTTGTPNTHAGPVSGGPVTGVGVYDTESGHVARHWIRTPHGLMTNVLTWADTDTVVFTAAQYVGGDDASARGQQTGRGGPADSWTVGHQPVPLPHGVSPSYLEGAAHGWILVATSSSRAGHALRLVDLTGRSPGRYLPQPSTAGSVNELHEIAVDETGRRLAAVADNRLPNGVVAGVSGHLRAVPRTRGTYGVLGWLDSDTIVTLRSDRNHGHVPSGLYRVSVATGESHPLVRFPIYSDTVASWQFATDLLGAPSVHATKPPRPLDPRWVTGLAAVTVLVALAVLVLWRRRVRP